MVVKIKRFEFKFKEKSFKTSVQSKKGGPSKKDKKAPSKKAGGSKKGGGKKGPKKKGKK